MNGVKFDEVYKIIDKWVHNNLCIIKFDMLLIATVEIPSNSHQNEEPDSLNGVRYHF